MCKWCLLLLIVVLFSCKEATKSKTGQKVIESVKLPLHDSVFDNVFNKDSVRVELAKDVENTDTHFYLTRSELHIIENNYQELVKGYTLEPDVSYGIANSVKCNHDTVFNGFESEAGRDNYYLFYSYFLKIRNGEERYKGMRDTLRQIFRTINGINDGLVNGGTYFGHQHIRIEGYIEYAIYDFDGEKQFNNETENNIDTQKTYFIKSLKQMISDELNNNNEYFGSERRKAKAKMFTMLEKIDALITNKFYLKEAQKFQYTHY